MAAEAEQQVDKWYQGGVTEVSPPHTQSPSLARKHTALSTEFDLTRCHGAVYAVLYAVLYALMYCAVLCWAIKGIHRL